MINPWFTKDRSETASSRTPDRALTDSITVQNPALGINVYKKAYSDAACKAYINTLESHLNGQTQYGWGGAQVTNSAEVDNYARNAKDFKIRRGTLGPRTEENAELYDMHEEMFQKLRLCMEDYGRYWGIGMSYYEAFNYVKYEGEGTHFRVHADHGPTYVATASAVMYLNDDYEGGEIFFPRFGVKLKTEPGDIVIFPSIFIYEHSSEPMISGTKYSVVVMTDYNGRDGVNQRVSQVIQNYELDY